MMKYNWLRVLASYEVKIAKICLWTFHALWPVIQLMHHPFKIKQKAFFAIVP